MDINRPNYVTGETQRKDRAGAKYTPEAAENTLQDELA